MSRLRVLLLAEACNPNWVSIPLEGWSLYWALREVADVHLVTQVRNRGDIEGRGLVEGYGRRGEAGDFTAIDSERVAGPIYRAAVLLRGGKSVGWTTQMALMSLSYPYYEGLVWKRFGREIEGGRFDLVHRLTPVSPTLGSPLARRCHEAGVPFVMGPLNGGIPWPRGWEGARLKEREVLSYVRSAYKLLPGYRETLVYSAGLVCGSKWTLEELPAWARGKSYYVPENAIDPEKFDRGRRRRELGELRVVFVGRLVPYKGADVLIEACAPLIREGRVSVTICGDGPMMGELKEMVRRERLEGRVHLLGNVPHGKLREILVEQDVFGFPSVREFGGAVVVEAMAMGVVPVVVGYGGPGELVSVETGVRIAVSGREGLVRAFREEIGRLAGNREEVERMSPRARERAMTRFTWGAKAREMVGVWEDVLSRSRAVSGVRGEKEGRGVVLTG